MPVLAPLLHPHLRDFERRLEPGLKVLTWTSMNIDAFLHSMAAGVASLEDLVSKAVDIIENRLDRNLRAVANLSLVELPSDESYSLDKFVAAQEKRVKAQAATLKAKNSEAEEAVSDLLELVATHPLKEGVVGRRARDGAKLRGHYSRMFYRAVLNCTKAALRAFKQRVGSRASGGFLFIDRPIFDVNVELSIPQVSMSPTLDEVQAAINRACRAILAIAKGLPMWATDEDKVFGRTVFDALAQDTEVVVMVLLLTGSLEGAKRQVHEYLSTFGRYDRLWQGDKESEYAAFMRAQPTLSDFEAELKKYVDVEREIAHIAPVHNIGALSLETAPLKYSLRSEAAAWKSMYGRCLHKQASELLEATLTWMRDMHRNLKRELRSIDDVRLAIGLLKELRERESSIDDYLAPVEETYATLSRYEVRLEKEELDQVHDLRYTWRKLVAVSTEVSADLQRVQTDFKRDLVRNVKAFVVDVAQFRTDFETLGPMVPGITPAEANNRLKKFQEAYAQRERKCATYSAGEALFGLPGTDYPELARTKKELDLLDRLYSLYMDVNEAVEGWRDMAWDAVGAELAAVQARIGEFQLACTRMPKELRLWDAYVDLKRLIDDFCASMPLVQQLAHHSMRMRHWSALMAVTGVHLPVGTVTFRLVNVLDAGLLEYREEVEDIANSAVKELQIEEKISAISDDWSDEQLTFGHFKARGQITLKGGETAELMEKVEETLMALGSMLASRYVAPFRELVQAWVTKLSSVSDVLEVWVQVQAMWQYLEAVFTSGARADGGRARAREATRSTGAMGAMGAMGAVGWIGDGLGRGRAKWQPRAARRAPIAGVGRGRRGERPHGRTL